MRARTLIFLAGLCLVPAHLAAQVTGPMLYVSNTNGEILSVDSATGEAQLLQILPESDIAWDIEVCGDRRLYIATFDKIYRMKRDGTELESIFEQRLSDPQTPLGTYFPAGLACDGSGNLLTNSRFSNGGVWRIANVAGTPFGGTFAEPQNMTGDPPISYGEDLVVLKDGSIAAVVGGEDRVVRFAPGFGEQSDLIPMTFNFAPAGFGQSVSGDFFAAEIDQVRRYDREGNLLGDYSAFAEGEFPYMLELDLQGNVYVATMSGVYRLGTDSSQRLVASIPGATGMAIDFATAPPAIRALTFDRISKTATADLGNSTFGISLLGKVGKRAFTMTVERRLVAPADLPPRITFFGSRSDGDREDWNDYGDYWDDLAALVGDDAEDQSFLDSQTGVSALSLPGDNGFVTVLSVSNPPKKAFEGSMQIRWAFNFDGPMNRMRLLHEISSGLETRVTDEINGFSAVGDSEIGRIATGVAKKGGRFLLASEGFAHQRYACGVEPVSDPLQTVTAGTSLRIRFQLKTNADCSGSVDPWALAQLSVVRVGDDHAAMQRVRSGLYSALADYFWLNPQTNYHVYQLRTDGYSAGLHCATIRFSSPWAGASPVTTCFNVAP